MVQKCSKKATVINIQLLNIRHLLVIMAMAKNGSSRCFLAKNGCTCKNSGRECCWPYSIGQHPLHLPFLAKSDRVLPVIASLLSTHLFLAILCSFPVGYSTTRTGQLGPQELIVYGGLSRGCYGAYLVTLTGICSTFVFFWSTRDHSPLVKSTYV